ncbi:MAG: hypothetical protein LUG66_08615 [Clostridiales bacterium]|nr:hypothetical protein [Clostridiales bacterium]
MKRFKKTAAAAASLTALAVSCCPVLAGEVNTTVYNNNTSAVEDLKGRIEFNRQTDISIEDADAGSITTTKVNINTQKISSEEGEVIISNDTATKYENVKSPVIVDVEVDINSPIVFGDADVTIENSSETTFEDADAAYIYKYGYSYNNVVRVPYIDSGGNVIINK